MPNLNLKNFAKIKDSDFDIKDITVFAGKPGTGKSYIMKMLYAMYDAFNKNKDDSTSIIKRLNEIDKQIDELINNETIADKDKLQKLEKIRLDTKIAREKATKNQSSTRNTVNIAYKNIFNSIFSNLEEINNEFKINYLDIELHYKDSKLTSITDDSKLFIKSENNIFVETPLILEFKKFMNRAEGKTPHHIESLLNILDKDYSDTDEEQDEFIKSFMEKSKIIIKGNIENSGDSFIFKTNDNKNYDIVNASSGIKSIGLLQYLVINKALKKGSVLFWEEPEVHLHPTWQLKMIDLFVELMNAGVKIVFSTHSPFMADYLNAKAQREKLSDRVSFNLLSEENGVVSNTILNNENWNLLQSELLDPLEEIMWEYL